MYIFVFPSSVRKFEELNYRLSCSFFLYSRWKICYYQRCLKLYCRHVNISATKLMILRGMAVINERAVLYTGCPRQADHGIATFSVASSKPSLPIVLVATIMYYVTTIRYLRIHHVQHVMQQRFCHYYFASLHVLISFTFMLRVHY